MIIRALSATGDFTFGQGVQNYLRDGDAIALNVQTRLKSFLADCFWAMDAGIDWWNLLGQQNPTAQAAIVVACRTTIASSYGVVKINSITSATDRLTRRLTVTFDIDTIFSRNVVGSAQP